MQLLTRWCRSLQRTDGDMSERKLLVMSIVYQALKQQHRALFISHGGVPTAHGNVPVSSVI